MKIELYTKLTDYLLEHHNNLTQTEKDFVIRKFLNSYAEAIQQEQGDMTDEKLMTIGTTLLSSENIDSFVTSAGSYYSKIEENFKTQYDKNASTQAFLTSVLSSIIGSFLYSLLLIIVFYVASDSIKGWLNSIDENSHTQKTEQKKPNKTS